MALLSNGIGAHAEPSPRFKAVAFDYFFIFDPNSVVPKVEKVFPGKGLEFTKAWRAKQFEYGFLRSITDNEPHGATLTDAIRAAEALDAMEQSAATGSWVTLPTPPQP